jgi:hypothetical protein
MMNTNDVKQSTTPLTYNNMLINLNWDLIIVVYAGNLILSGEKIPHFLVVLT